MLEKIHVEESSRFELRDSDENYIHARKWQRIATMSFMRWFKERQSGDSRTFVAAVTGGAGKTYYGAFIAKNLEPHDIGRVIVVCPSNTIVNQWLKTLNHIKLQRDAVQWDGNYTGAANIVTTYHMMANNSQRLRHVVNQSTIVIFDECHHLADSASWGESAREVAQNAAYRLMLTATAFREDDAKIPLVTYSDGLLQTNYQYPYGDALDDGYVRPIYFHMLNSLTEWREDDKLHSVSLEKEFGSTVIGGALNVALLPTADWLKAVIKEANDMLMTNRKYIPNAAGIITCKDQEHARAVKRLVQKITGTNPILAISDDKTSDEKIDTFRDDDTPWLIVVRKGSEGLDIPRLRVGVYATNITTELYFLQFLMRLIRRGEDISRDEQAHLYMPTHPKLIDYARRIREMRTHALKEETPESPVGESREKGEQSKVITPISATPGQLTHINVDAKSSPLEKLIWIQEQATSAINTTAIGGFGWNDELHHNRYLTDALRDIADLLNVQYQPEKPKTGEPTPIDIFENNRQWTVFKRLYNEIKKLPDWNLEVLSLLWHINGEGLTGNEILDRVPDATKRLYSDNRTSENKLIEHNLMVYEDKHYRCNATEHLMTICPMYDPENLLGYLLTGILPEKSS